MLQNYNYATIFPVKNEVRIPVFKFRNRELLLRHKIIILDICGGFFSSKALDPVIGLIKVTQLERARFQVSSDVLFFVQSY